jgi:hypothetical protein
MKYELQYSSLRTEVWKAYWRAWASLHGLWIYHLFMGFFVALLVLVEKQVGLNEFFLAWLLASLACVACFSLWPLMRFKSTTRSLTVGASGYQTTIGKLRGSRTWKEIDRIEDAGKEILIVGKNGNMMVIPQRAFTTQEQRNDFFRDIKSWHENYVV